ncbi:hypothetical protein [Arcobacter peruensis]|uniref:hypothetical protein n=1 Tax=Arcobacter peruensis TaxID=2320140 RepID=UPI000F090A73|nr:hypothetical protein [Arcobacter peruensis]
MTKVYKIVKKGKEDFPWSISRSNKYLKYPAKSLLLADHDPDPSMPEHMFLKDFKDFYNALLKIMPKDFEKVECLIGSGSSSGIKNSKGELVYNSNSMHAYWPNINASDDSIKRLNEYIKRACIFNKLYYLKIHKDGSCSMRYQIDLAVLSSSKSRLVFESKPTCKDGLYQEKPVSLIWNIKSKETLDLSQVSYDHLPDWKPIYEQLKNDNKELIKETKEKYKALKLSEYISSGLTPEVATRMIDRYLEQGLLSVKTIVEVN